MVVLRVPSSETAGAQTPWLPNGKGLGNRPSQRSLHNAPIFRLLLKVAVKGTHQCDLSNFCGGFWSPTFKQRIANFPRVGVEAADALPWMGAARSVHKCDAGEVPPGRYVARLWLPHS